MPQSNLIVVHDSSAPPLVPEHLSDHDGEPRIRDLMVAERLGFNEPRAIRKLIARNLVELRTYGEVRDAVSQTSQAGGRPGTEYWLNEGQALVLCALSRTPQAAAVRRQLIECFMAWRRGAEPPRLKTPPRQIEKPIEPLTVDDIADAEAIPRVGGDALERVLRADLVPLIRDNEADLSLLAPMRYCHRTPGRGREYLLTESQALRLCAVAGGARAPIAASQVVDAFAEFRRRQHDEQTRQQETIKALTSELVGMRALLTHHADNTPINDRLARLEKKLGLLAFDRRDVKHLGSMLGLSANQEQTLARWLEAAPPLTEAQERFRKRWHAQRSRRGGAA